MALHVAAHLLPRLHLVGECNRCGACCRGAGWRCTHLDDDPDGTTTCRVYAERVDGMAITLRHDDGTAKAGQCFKDSPIETALILPHVGGPCGFTIQLDRPEGG